MKLVLHSMEKVHELWWMDVGKKYSSLYISNYYETKIGRVPVVLFPTVVLLSSYVTVFYNTILILLVIR